MAIHILLSDNLLKSYTIYAEQLLKHFVISTKIINRVHFLSHNIHNLLHLTDDVDDVKKFGNLDSFSNFPFENYLQKLKGLLRKHTDILSQIIRRLSEENNISNYKIIKEASNDDVVLAKEHSNGVLLNNLSGPQYQEALFNNFKLNIFLPNSCCKLKCNSIIEVENFAFCPQQSIHVLIGRKYGTVKDFYTEPCNSSIIGIYFVENLADDYFYCPITDVIQKFVRYLFSTGFVVIPLLHINDEHE